LRASRNRVENHCSIEKALLNPLSMTDTGFSLPNRGLRRSLAVAERQ
jgi:hypothetical protein